MLEFLRQYRLNIRQFCKSESGAISVDWVTLTAALIAMVLLGVATITGSVEEIATWVANQLIGTEVG
ncbi:MAG: hypothetical protein AAF922_19065 [Pseudomonadota bacterium]